MTSSAEPERERHAIRSAATFPSGRYPIDRRAGEIERLRIQADAMAPDTAIMLERIGVRPGWRCLDLGCGPGGITELLCARAGAAGQVVGLDTDKVFLDAARTRAGQRAGLEFELGDAYRTGLPSGRFDLVHVRFVAGTSGEPEKLLEEMIRLARAGGTVAFQEPDVSTLNCYPPHPAWTRLRDALRQAFAAVGADELDAALAACRAHLADPDTVFTTFTVAQVWGRLKTEG